ncbi:tRNA (guanosine(46)-N7)-methyltransferase TrmB [Nanchangia anserum]|uniref:tRNA (guanine-N(7)-)-methyltransferase n=2 Tax=Nanchangia anserum TaxID=2692125 RepID=A0A8I0G787_9ACTO|nr:tRNA (guanosine(46)-N7)-methyltransferase TrmB [Nanchangia anserum]MBD3689102.1 tRNA (guanosine(46)-N7)-methyltransferase TrmB [Nanchangia anserum]QOX82629.1 tRNA (guanosine(46)-N7)-methyltransferase TrmB [Nanchangia anserum]
MARTKSFVSRARHLSPSLQQTWDAHAGDYVIDIPRGSGETMVAEDAPRLNWRQVFGRESVVRCEIGSGNGDQIVGAAAAHPERDYVAFEVYHPGVAKTVAKAHKAGLTNLRIIEADAQHAIPIIFDDHCLDELWVFFPDPWRKSRHHKRRLVQPAFAAEVGRILRPGGLWRLATDWADYAFQMRTVVEDSPFFTNPYAGMNPDPADPEGERGGFAPRWDGRVLTNFERRGVEAGRVVRDVCGQRVP